MPRGLLTIFAGSCTLRALYLGMIIMLFRLITQPNYPRRREFRRRPLTNEVRLGFSR